MPSETNTDKIARLEKLTAVLEQQIAQQEETLDRVETDLRREINSVVVKTTESAGRLQTVEKDSALTFRDVQKLEKRVDEVLTHRWKLFLAAFLGSLLTIAAGWVNRSLERLFDPGQARQPPAKSAPSPR